jgi:integrase
MPTVKFILQKPYLPGLKDRKKVLNPKDTRLYAFLIIGRGRVAKLKTEHTIEPKKWDFEKQGLKEKLPGSIEFNADLAAMKNDILSQYKSIMKRFPDITFNDLATRLKEYSKTKNVPVFSEKNLPEILQEYIDSLGGEVAPGTIAKFVTLKKSLKAFSESNKKYESLSFSQIDHIFYDDYVKYLRTLKPRGRQLRRPEGLQTGLLNDTIGKYLECLKSFLRWAEDRGYNQYRTYIKFKNTSSGNKKRKAEKRNIVSLSIKELTKFYYHDFSARPALERVRDVFCFACFVGARWSDIERFNKEDLKGDVWSFIAFKTKKRQEVDLTGFSATALDILRKYNFELPRISLQKFNDQLKVAGEEAGINAPVKLRRYSGVTEIITEEPKYYFMSSHMARRTHVSIMLNVFNVAPSLIMSRTGHADLKTLTKYLDEDRTALRDAMSKTISVTEIMKVTHKKAAV